MLLPLAYYGNPILRTKSKKVPKITDELIHLVEDMFETMKKNNGIGLAANQINKALRVFVMEVPIKVSQEGEEDRWESGTPYVFINPVILSKSEELNVREEGCLSIPTVYAEVTRPLRVVVQATDLQGNLFRKEFSGLEARCIQHENDHIDGILFIDHLSPEKREALMPHLQEVKQRLHKKGV